MNNNLNLEIDNIKIYFKNIKGNVNIVSKKPDKFILQFFDDTNEKKKLDLSNPFDQIINKIDNEIRKLEIKSNKLNQECDKVILNFNIEKKINNKKDIKKQIKESLNLEYKNYEIKSIENFDNAENMLYKYIINNEQMNINEYFLIIKSISLKISLTKKLNKSQENLLINFLLSASLKKYNTDDYIEYNKSDNNFNEKSDLIRNESKLFIKNNILEKKYNYEFDKINNLIKNYNLVNNIKIKNLFNYLILGNNIEECKNIGDYITKKLIKFKIIDSIDLIQIEGNQNLTKLYDKINKYSDKFKFIKITGFENIEPINKIEIINYLLKKINYDNLIGIMIIDNKKNSNIYKNYEEMFFKFNSVEYNCDEIYKILISKLKKNNLKYKFNKKEMLNYIKILYNKSKVRDEIFVDNLLSIMIRKKLESNLEIINKECLPIIKNSEIYNLEKLVGLKDLKADINKLENYWKYRKFKFNDRNNIYINSVFMGNPGTGKTTVAKIITHKLFELGYIKKDKIIEVTPNNLVGQYLGQTVTVINKIFQEAEDGVLFIDEAYLLLNKNEFFQEALVEILKYMENPKHVVFFAGYEKQIKQFIECNSGLKSRITYNYTFPDLSVFELITIFKNKILENNLKIDKKAIDKIIYVINNAKVNKDFGNGRFIDKIFNLILIEHSTNVKNFNNDLISENDVNIENIFLHLGIKQNKFGFLKEV